MSARTRIEERKGRGPRPTGPGKGVWALVAVGLIVGSGILAYSIDDIYLEGKADLAVIGPAMVDRNGSAEVFVSLLDRKGTPVPDRRVEARTRSGTVIASAETDRRGQAILVLPGSDLEDGEITVSAGGEEQCLSVAVTESCALPPDAVRVLLMTDKPIYQPLQTVLVRVLCVYGGGRGCYKGDLVLEVVTPAGEIVDRQELRTDAHGVAATSWTVSDQLPLGHYTLRARIAGRTVTQRFRVDRYVLPRFAFSYDGLRPWYLVSEPILFELNVSYLFGKPVSGRYEVTARVYWGVWVEVGRREGTLSGRAAVAFDPVRYAPGITSNADNGYLELNVTVTDEGGHTETRSRMIILARHSLMVTLISDTNLMGAESHYLALVQWPDGSPVPGAAVDATIGTTKVRSVADVRGLAPLDFVYEGQSFMELEAAFGEYRATETYQLGSDRGIKLVPDAYIHDVGEVARFAVLTGSGSTRFAYYQASAEGFTLASGRLEVEGGRASFDLPLPPSSAGTVAVSVYRLTGGGDLLGDTALIAVRPTSRLEVDVTPAFEGRRLKVGIDVTENGTGVPSAAVGFRAVDRAVFELAGSMEGFEGVWFALEAAAADPTYQLWEYVYGGGASVVPETGVVSRRGGSSASLVASRTLPGHLAEARDRRDRWVGAYWGLIGLACFGALFAGLGHLVLFPKRRGSVAAAAGAAAAVLVSLALVIAGVLIVWATSPPSSEGKTSTTKGGREIDDGLINPWWNGGMANPEEGENGAIGVLEREEGSGYSIQANEGSNPGRVAPPHVRDWFPETWAWRPLLLTDAEGRIDLSLDLPDSMTSYFLEATASTLDGEVGVGTANVSLRSDFFVEPDIPGEAVRNDSFPLAVQVYNYAGSDAVATVLLEDCGWFDLEGPTAKTVAVPAGGVRSVSFRITARTVGTHHVTVFAYAGSLADAVTRELRVVPDGLREAGVANGFLEDGEAETLRIDLSPDRVPGSENAFVKVQGGAEAVVLDGAEGFIRFVTGCGEQSLSRLSVDVLAYALASSDPDIPPEKLFEYETIVRHGIEHELQYLVEAKSGEGRGIVWFPGDRDAHPWLTSWGLLTFADAIEAGFEVDTAIVEEMRDFLLSQQRSDGSFEFPEWGLYEFTNPLLRSKQVATTAYIVRSLLASGLPASHRAIRDAVGYLKANIEDQRGVPYTVALALLALSEAGEAASGLDEDLLNLARTDEGGNLYWTSEWSMITDRDGDPASIEATGYAAMALQRIGRTSESASAIAYIVEHRSALGGWSATQDTVVGLRALASTGMEGTDDMRVALDRIVGLDDLSDPRVEPIEEIAFTPRTKGMTFFVDLRPYLSDGRCDLRLAASGTGRVAYQVVWEEWIPYERAEVEPQDDLLLEVSYDATEVAVNDTITATLRMVYNGCATLLRMVVVGLRAPVGFSFVDNEMEAIVAQGIIDMFEHRGEACFVYIADLRPGAVVSFSYRLRADAPVRGAIQGIYAEDMYNPGVCAVVPPVVVESA